MKDRGAHSRAYYSAPKRPAARRSAFRSTLPWSGARDREHRTYRFPRDPISFLDYPANYWRYPTTWKDIEWVRSQTKLPLGAQGRSSIRQDADRGIRAGAAAIYVSNHGGRNLDTLPATLEVLPEVAEKVSGRVPIVVDGGVRRGTDVLKALASGATVVAIGRPYLYGLAVLGADGVSGVINVLRNELEMAMALTGRPTIASIDRSLIRAAAEDFKGLIAGRISCVFRDMPRRRDRQRRVVGSEPLPCSSRSAPCLSRSGSSAPPAMACRPARPAGRWNSLRPLPEFSIRRLSPVPRTVGSSSAKIIWTCPARSIGR